jgi:hypothetical protein
MYTLQDLYDIKTQIISIRAMLYILDPNNPFEKDLISHYIQSLITIYTMLETYITKHNIVIIFY